MFDMTHPGRGLEVKYIALSSLAETGDVGRIRGYASRFGEPDEQGDVVRPGAFAASLKALERAGRRVKFLWQHDPTCPIGIWHQVHEDAVGLYVSGELLTQIRLGSEAVTLMQAGAVDGLSIGYRVLRAEPNRETGGRDLIEIDLWEVSLVTFPMLPSARAMITPQTEPAETIDDVLADLLASDG